VVEPVLVEFGGLARDSAVVAAEGAAGEAEEVAAKRMWLARASIAEVGRMGVADLSADETWSAFVMFAPVRSVGKGVVQAGALVLG
jgi:hypothetical protein